MFGSRGNGKKRKDIVNGYTEDGKKFPEVTYGQMGIGQNKLLKTYVDKLFFCSTNQYSCFVNLICITKSE